MSAISKAAGVVNDAANIAKSIPTSNIPAISLPALIGVNKTAAVASKLLGEAEEYVVGEVKSALEGTKLSKALEKAGFLVKEDNEEHPGVNSRDIGQLLQINRMQESLTPTSIEMEPNSIRDLNISNNTISINNKIPKNSSRNKDKNSSEPIIEDTSINSAPKKLITRDKIQNSNSVTAYKHRWAITLEKMGQASIDNPFSSQHYKVDGDEGLILSDHLLPATAFRYETYKASIEELSFLSGISISIPAGYSLVKTISVTIMNDCQDAMRSYLRAYRKSVCPTYKSAVPYKDACSKLILYIYNAQLNLMDSYELYVIPDFSDEAVSDQELKSYDVSFYILGESDTNPGI